jgi:hypothetical protein
VSARNLLSWGKVLRFDIVTGAVPAQTAHRDIRCANDVLTWQAAAIAQVTRDAGYVGQF